MELDVAPRIAAARRRFGGGVAATPHEEAATGTGGALCAAALYIGGARALGKLNLLAARLLRRLRRKSRTFLCAAHEVPLLTAMRTAIAGKLPIERHGTTLFWR